MPRFDFRRKPVEVGPAAEPTIGHHGADATPTMAMNSGER
jgi:hypothetical protein